MTPIAFLSFCPSLSTPPCCSCTNPPSRMSISLLFSLAYCRYTLMRKPFCGHHLGYDHNGPSELGGWCAWRWMGYFLLCCDSCCIMCPIMMIGFILHIGRHHSVPWFITPTGSRLKFYVIFILHSEIPRTGNMREGKERQQSLCMQNHSLSTGIPDLLLPFASSAEAFIHWLPVKEAKWDLAASALPCVHNAPMCLMMVYPFQ